MTDPDAGARATLRLIGPDPANWVPDRDGVQHNVVIVGGGQTGCAFAFALRRAGVGRVSVIDAAPDPERAGIWLTGARMNVLRTPKTLPGPELGIAALSFRAWYEARYGEAAYASFERIPRLAWAEYVAWYRHFLGIAVRYGVRLKRIEPTVDQSGDGHFHLHLDIAGASAVETTRKVIIATGFEGSGGIAIPEVLSGLPRALSAHAADDIDFAALVGKEVAVIGAAASAFDAAAVALEAGVKSVHLFARRPALAATPINRSRGYPGAYDNYYSLPDAVRWHQSVRYRRAGSTPPQDAIERVLKFPNFHLHLAAPWHSARAEAGRIVAQAADGTYRFDFVIAGTGYAADPNLRPEFADFAGQIMLWRDRFTPPADEEDPFLGAHPYLGPGNEFLEKTPGAAPYLGDIHCFNPAGFVSFGVPVGDVPSMKRGHPTVTAQISRDLFLADLDHHQRRMTGNVPADFGPDLYARAVWKPA